MNWFFIDSQPQGEDVLPVESSHGTNQERQEQESNGNMDERPEAIEDDSHGQLQRFL